MIGVACAVTVAHAQGNSVRLGNPLKTAPVNAVSVATDADQPPGHASSPDTAVLDVQLPKMYYDAGEPVVLTTHLRTRGGRDLEGGDMEVDDTVARGVMDHEAKPGKRRKGQAKGHGKHRATLDNSPGDHNLVVSVDALDKHGNSIHRAAAHVFVVSTGELQFKDVGSVYAAGGALVVPLKVKVTGRQQPGDFLISAILANEQTAVARAEVLVDLPPGDATVELRFQQSHIVEPGPYHLVGVMANGSNEWGATLAAAPHDLGRPFQAAHADHEPEPLRNEDGAIVQGGPQRVLVTEQPEYVPGHVLAPGDQVGVDPNPITPPE
jgi:hypothetical protein